MGVAGTQQLAHVLAAEGTGEVDPVSGQIELVEQVGLPRLSPRWRRPVDDAVLAGDNHMGPRALVEHQSSGPQEGVEAAIGLHPPGGVGDQFGIWPASRGG